MTRAFHPLQPTRRLQARVARRLALVWLLLALVVVPTLGRLHQVAHGGALDQMHAGQQAPAAAEQGHGPWPSSFLAHHAPADCLLLDQLALGDALHSATLALPDAVPPQALPPHSAGRAGVSHIALFQARGPPAA